MILEHCALSGKWMYEGEKIINAEDRNRGLGVEKDMDGKLKKLDGTGYLF